MENVPMSFAAFFLLLYFIALAVEKKPTWFLSKRLREVLKME